MRIQQSRRQGCVVLTLAGRLDQAVVPQLRRTILKHLGDQPPAIICDLTRWRRSTHSARGHIPGARVGSITVR